MEEIKEDMIDYLINKVKELFAKLKGNGKRISKKELMEKLKEKDEELNKTKKERDEMSEDRDAYKKERNKYFNENVKNKNALAKLQIENDSYRKDSERYKRRSEKNQELYENMINNEAAALRNLQISGQMAVEINIINGYIVKMGPQLKDMEKAIMTTNIDFNDFNFIKNKYQKRFNAIDTAFNEGIIDKLNKLYDSVDKNSDSSYFHISLDFTIRKCLTNLNHILGAFKEIIEKKEIVQNTNVNFGKEIIEMQNYYAKLINAHLNSCNSVVTVLKRISSSPRIIWID